MSTDPARAPIRPTDDVGSDGRRRRVLTACLGGLFASTFTITILGVSLRPIADDLGTDVATIAWVMTGPMLAQALSLPVLGRMGDLYGHRRVYLIGFAISAFAAVLTAFAWDAASLIGFRCFGQLAGTATMPASTALLFHAYPARERVRAMGWVSLVSAGSPVLGLAVGGVLVDQLGWRPIFAIQAVLSVVAVLYAARVLEESERGPDPRLDRLGAATLAIAAFALTFAINRSPVWGVFDVRVLAAMATLPVALWLFVRVERATDVPLLPLEFFGKRNFVAPLVVNFAMNFAYMGGFIISPLLLIQVFGFNAATTSFIVLWRPVAFALASPISGRIAMSAGERRTAVVGTVLITLSMLGFCVAAALIDSSRSGAVVALMFGLVVAGVGFGFTQPSIQAIVGNAVAESHFGIASSALSMSGSVGAVAGISFLTALCADAVRAGPYLAGYGLAALASAVALAGAWAIGRREQLTPASPGATPGPASDRAA